MKNDTLIFAGYDFYPLGGIKDLYSYGSMDLEMTKVFMNGCREDYNWCHVYDPVSRKILLFGKRNTVTNAEETEFLLSDWVWKEQDE